MAVPLTGEHPNGTVSDGDCGRPKKTSGPPGELEAPPVREHVMMTGLELGHLSSQRESDAEGSESERPSVGVLPLKEGAVLRPCTASK